MGNAGCCGRWAAQQRRQPGRGCSSSRPARASLIPAAQLTRAAHSHAGRQPQPRCCCSLVGTRPQLGKRPACAAGRPLHCLAAKASVRDTPQCTLRHLKPPADPSPAGSAPPPCQPPLCRGTRDVPPGRPRPPAAGLLCAVAGPPCAAAGLHCAAAGLPYTAPPLLAAAAATAAPFHVQPAGEPGFVSSSRKGLGLV